MSDNKFIPGLIVKGARDGAPDYVKGKISIKVNELKEWLQTQQGEWVNLDIKVSQQGKWYAAIDDWKPNGQQSGGQRQQAPRQQGGGYQNQTPPPMDDFADEDLPF